jgi:hypothetical protein
MFGRNAKTGPTPEGAITFTGKSAKSDDVITVWDGKISKRGEDGTFSLVGVKAEVRTQGAGTKAMHWLIVEGPEFGWSGRVAQLRITKAINFALEINLAARKAEAQA